LQRIEPQEQIRVGDLTARSEHVPLLDQCGNAACKLDVTAALRMQQHVRETRVQWEPGQRAAVRGDTTGFVESIQLAQQLARLRERARGWRVQPLQLRRIRRSPRSELECERR